MDFQERLQRAVQRGRHTQAKRQQSEAARELSEEEYKRLHLQYRLPLSEKIETCLGQLADSFPGFRYATVLGEEGWGGAVRRDDTEISGRRRNEYFSRLQLVVRPYSQYRVLDLSAKGTVRNKEVLTRTNFQKLDDADLDIFLELVELWVLEYAELYASTNN